MVPFGTGLHLKPWLGSELDGVGEGLYLKKGSGFVNGARLILGRLITILFQRQSPLFRYSVRFCR